MTLRIDFFGTPPSSSAITKAKHERTLLCGALVLAMIGGGVGAFYSSSHDLAGLFAASLLIVAASFIALTSIATPSVFKPINAAQCDQLRFLMEQNPVINAYCQQVAQSREITKDEFLLISKFIADKKEQDEKNEFYRALKQQQSSSQLK